MTTSTKDLGPLGQAAANLENDFREIDRLSAALANFTDGGKLPFEQARKLLEKFGEVGARLGGQIQILAETLEESRERAEAACREVSKRAELIQKRSRERADMSERFQLVARRVQEVSTALSQIIQNQAGDGDKAQLLSSSHEQLAVLAAEAEQLRVEAGAADFNELETEAATMADRLRLSGKKIKRILESNPD